MIYKMHRGTDLEDSTLITSMQSDRFVVHQMNQMMFLRWKWPSNRCSSPTDGATRWLKAPDSSCSLICSSLVHRLLIKKEAVWNAPMWRLSLVNKAHEKSDIMGEAHSADGSRTAATSFRSHCYFYIINTRHEGRQTRTENGSMTAERTVSHQRRPV